MGCKDWKGTNLFRLFRVDFPQSKAARHLKDATFCYCSHKLVVSRCFSCHFPSHSQLLTAKTDIYVQYVCGKLVSRCHSSIMQSCKMASSKWATNLTAVHVSVNPCAYVWTFTPSNCSNISFVFLPAMKSGGTQLKLIMTFQNYGQALFKPMK